MNSWSAYSDPQRLKRVSQCQPLPEFNVKVVGTSPELSNLCTLLLAVSSAVWSSNKDNVCRSTVEEQLKKRVVHLSEPSATSLLLISPGLS